MKYHHLRNALTILVCAAMLLTGCSTSDEAPLAPDADMEEISARPTLQIESPLPFPERINDTWVSPSGVVFAVGRFGNIAYFKDGEWTSMDSGVYHDLNGIWGTDNDNIFAVGNHGCMIHFAGSEWRPLESNHSDELVDIAGVPGKEIYAVASKAILRSDDNGATWKRVPLPPPSGKNYTCIDGPDADTFYIGATRGLFSFDGSVLLDLGGDGSASDVWAAGNGDVYIAGFVGVWRYTRGQSQQISTGFTTAIEGTDPDNYYAVGGASGAPIVLQGTTTSLTAIDNTPLDGNVDACALLPDGTLLVGRAGESATYNGTTWTEIPGTEFDGFNDIYGIDEDNIYGVGDDGMIVRFENDRWVRQQQNVTTDNVNSVWGSAPDDVYAVSRDNILHFDGSVWRDVNHGLDASSVFLNHVSGSASDNVYVGSNELWHFDGATWNDLTQLVLNHTGSSGTRALWVAPTGEAFVGFDSHLLIIDDGDVRSIHLTQTASLSVGDIWGTSADNVYVVDSSDYYVYRWNGRELNLEITFSDVSEVWAASPSNVFVAGSDEFHHFDGRSWQSIPVPHGRLGVLGGFGENKFALGSSGSITRIIQ